MKAVLSVGKWNSHTESQLYRGHSAGLHDQCSPVSAVIYSLIPSLAAES